jgi:hypothetical protein
MRYFILVFGLIVALSGFSPVKAAEIYHVQDVKVSATAANAKKAKQEAVDKAQIEAFKILVSRADLSDEFFLHNRAEILSAAREYEVKDESIAKSSYSGVFDVYFSVGHVSELLSKHDVDSKALGLDSYLLSRKPKSKTADEIVDMVDDDSTAVYPDSQDFAPQDRKLIIPLFGFEGKVFLWGENNLWLHQWKNRIDIAGESGVVVPLGDESDINNSKFNILLANYKSFTKLLQKYKATQVLIAFAELKKVRGIYKLNVSMKTLNGKHEYSYLKQYYEFSGAATSEMLSEAFYKVLNTKADNQYDLKNLEIQISDNLEVEAIFNPETFADWTALSSVLEKVPTVKKVSLVEFNAQTMIVSIIFKSSLEEFRKNLSKRGYRLIDVDKKFVIKKE